MFTRVSVPRKTFRLIPTKYPPIQTFEGVASEEDLEAVIELEGWTNDRLVKHRLQRLPEEQWVYGTGNASIVMAAFLHSPVNGLRFNSGELGAWYCSTDARTAIAEVSLHLRREAINSGMEEMRSKYRTYIARLSGKYMDLRGKQNELPEIYDCDNWAHSQVFGEEQRARQEDGIFYSSVRYTGGSNVVAFKPKQINDVTIGHTYDISVPVKGKIIARELA